MSFKSLDLSPHISDSNEVTATTPSDDATTPASGARIETEYNLADKVVAVRDWLGVTTAEYDELNRDKKITDVYGRTTQYEYDANGSRSALVYHDGHRVEYSYDADNRLTTVTTNNSPLTSYQYDAGGNITRQDNLNGTYTLVAFLAGMRPGGEERSLTTGYEPTTF